MGTDAGTIQSEVRLLLSDLRKDVARVETNLDKITKKSKETSEKSTKAFGTLKKVLIGIGAAAIFRGVVSGFKKIINSASDAEETTAKLGTVYKGLEQQVKITTDELVKSYGLSSRGAQQLLGDTGDLLTGFGFTKKSALDLSTEVQKLAVDLASFTNFAGGAEGASQALTKALLGERESVKVLGIAILEADVQAKILQLRQEGLTFETDRQAKAFATLKIAQEQSKNAMGDFARTSEGFANQTRILKARLDNVAVTLGKVFLPIATKVVGKFIDMFEGEEDLKTVTEDLIRLEGERTKVLDELATSTGDLADEEFRRNIALKVTLEAAILDRVTKINKGYKDQKERITDLTEEIKDNKAALTVLNLEQFSALNTEQARERSARRFLKLDNETKKLIAEKGKLLKIQGDSEAFLADAIEKGKISAESLRGVNAELVQIASALILLNKSRAEQADKNNEKDKETKQLTKDQIKLLDELKLKQEELNLTEEELDFLKIERERNKSLEILKGNQEGIDSINKYYDALRDNTAYEQNATNEEELAKKRKKLWELSFSAIGSLAGDFFTVQANLAEEGSQKEKDAKKRAFVADKIFRSAQLFVSGIQSAQMAWNLSTATFPFPVGQIIGGTLAALILGGTAAGIGKISSARANFQFGGIVPGSRSQGVDSVPSNLTPREAVLTEEQQSRFLDIADGNSGSGQTILQLVTQSGAVLDEFVFNRTKNGQMKVHANGLIALEEV